MDINGQGEIPPKRIPHKMYLIDQKFRVSYCSGIEVWGQ